MSMRHKTNAAAALQVGYVKNGIDVIPAPFDDALLGVALQIEVNGKTVKTAAVNGKLRRGERREIVKMLIRAIESGWLINDEKLAIDGLSRIITREGYDLYKGGLKNENGS